MTAPTISIEGLRELLERGAPVTVLDVRPAAECAEWSIPGSVHADAYDALRRGDPNALADFRPTNGGPVVTVCAAGKTSMLAAERLRARGLDAVSLEGGMRAWSLAWNTAEVPCPGSTARIVQLRRTGKGCLSYLIGSNGDAAVVDASLEPKIYRRVADEHGWRIRTVLETHVHADHLSRARALAVDTGARLCLPTTDRVSFEYAPLKDGDTLCVGSAGLRVFHTPGHTPESACYLLNERVLFTGDTLFLAAVGRPDLEASAEQSCPNCPSGRLFRSRSHSMAERVRKQLTAQRLFRCEACGWRGWLLPPNVGEPPPIEAPVTPDLSTLDYAVAPHMMAHRASFSPRDLSGCNAIHQGNRLFTCPATARTATRPGSPTTRTGPAAPKCAVARST